MASENSGFDSKWILLLFLFIISYAVIFALAALSRALVSPLQGTVLEFLIPVMKWADWVSPMYFLLPAVGFFFVFLSVEWAKDYFKSSFPESAWFPALFTVFFIAAFWIAMFFFYLPNLLQGSPANICFPSCFGESGGSNIDYWHELKHSAFWLFYLGGMLGWLSHRLQKKLEGFL